MRLGIIIIWLVASPFIIICIISGYIAFQLTAEKNETFTHWWNLSDDE